MKVVAGFNGDEKSLSLMEKLWNELLRGKTIQFFILENIPETIREYAEEYFGNGVDDLARGWERVAKKAEYAVIEFYLDSKQYIWERIRVVRGKKSYIIFQYDVEPIYRYDPVTLGFYELVRKFEYSVAHASHTPAEFRRVSGKKSIRHI